MATTPFKIEDLMVSVSDDRKWLVFECGDISVIGTCMATKPMVQVKLVRGGDAELELLKDALRKLVKVKNPKAGDAP